MRARLFAFGSFAVFSIVIYACTGADPVAVPGDAAVDTGTDSAIDSGPVADADTTDATADATADATVERECKDNKDCQSYAASVTPPNCADAVCLPTGQCRLVAVDHDKDDDRTDTCSSPDLDVLLGTDCDDSDPNLKGGTSELCVPADAPAGTTLKTLTTGSCKAGIRRCGAMSGVPACAGAVFPKANDSCAIAGNDDNCDGVANGGCVCPLDKVRDCDNQSGACSGAQQKCVASGMTTAWGVCSKAPGALDCGGKTDNDCNGTVDSAQKECMCDGTTAVGTSGTCSTGLDGVCSSGMRTCGATGTGSTVAWGSCVQSTPKSTEQCDALKDYDCNGIAADDHTKCIGPAPSGACGLPLQASAILSSVPITTFTACKSTISSTVTWTTSACSATQTTGSSIRVVCAAQAPSGWSMLENDGTGNVGPYVAAYDKVCGTQCNGKCTRLTDGNNPCWIVAR